MSIVGVTMSIWEVVGWVGSALVVISLMVPSVRRFRWLNFIGSAIATVYNGIFEIWPFFAMNLIIAIIDVYWIIRLERGARQHKDYTMVPIGHDEPYLERFLDAHAKDVHKWYPKYLRDVPGVDREAFLVLHEDETIGAVIVEPHGDGADLLVDFVTPRFRDFTPGRFIYGEGGLAERLHVTELRIPDGNALDIAYFEAMGFTKDGNDLALAVSPRASID